MGKIKRDMSTPENRKFWAHLETVRKEIEGWPEWKRVASGLDGERLLRSKPRRVKEMNEPHPATMVINISE